MFVACTETLVVFFFSSPLPWMYVTERRMYSTGENAACCWQMRIPLQNKGRNSSFLHPAALCEAPDGTQLFPWPLSMWEWSIISPTAAAPMPHPYPGDSHHRARDKASDPGSWWKWAWFTSASESVPPFHQPLPLTFSCAAGMRCSFANPAHFLPKNRLWVYCGG